MEKTVISTLSVRSTAEYMVRQGGLGGVAKSLGSTADGAVAMAEMSGAAGLGRLGGGGNSKHPNFFLLLLLKSHS